MEKIKKDTEADFLTQFKLRAACELFGLPFENDTVFVSEGTVVSTDKRLNDVISRFEDLDMYKLMYLFNFGQCVPSHLDNYTSNRVGKYADEVIEKTLEEFKDYFVLGSREQLDETQMTLNYMCIYLRYMSIVMNIARQNTGNKQRKLLAKWDDLYEEIRKEVKNGNIGMSRVAAELACCCCRDDEAIAWLDKVVEKYHREDDIVNLCRLRASKAADKNKTPVMVDMGILDDLEKLRTPEADILLFDIYTAAEMVQEELNTVHRLYWHFKNLEETHKIGALQFGNGFEDFANNYCTLAYFAAEAKKLGFEDDCELLRNECDELAEKMKAGKLDGTDEFTKAGYSAVAEGLGISKELIVKMVKFEEAHLYGICKKRLDMAKASVGIRELKEAIHRGNNSLVEA